MSAGGAGAEPASEPGSAQESKSQAEPGEPDAPSESRRGLVVERLLERLRAVHPERRALVALDGVDGVGKSHLAAELVLRAQRTGGRPVVNVGIDGFHVPRAQRAAAGLGPEGAYRGSYDYAAFRACVVEPLRRGEPIAPEVWDVDVDAPVEPRSVDVPPGALVVVDGIFLQRPELGRVWDAVVWVDAPFEVTVPRGAQRYPGLHDPDPEAHSNHRYVGGQRLYLAEARPRERADWIFDNTDLERPVLR
ncbi:uridine kinase [Brevibacterium sp. BRM-1]|uniref:uridine kinase n=1 Tax=Brevibacterium sp. BRM-1 TaxID=2999062 RepID=UPI0022821CAC|nr:uridine kinase [Brevibacterium sp. BRM-1]WAL39721.1 uridine kinase [Brevibacterium sp. BRM-1]